jgi:uncharacterized repeat protein (TIGR01451 family)
MFEIPSYSGTSSGVPYIFYYPGESSTWIRTKAGEYFRFANHGSAANRSTPLFRIAYTVQMTPQTSAGVSGTPVTHKECSFYTGKWCGDGVVDSGNGEQCDNGVNNGSNGTCSSTCQNNQTLSCNGITVTPAVLTSVGGSIHATCTASSNATQYKFVLKEGLTTIDTVNYQNSNQTDFVLPTNATNTNKTYSVQCYVKNNTETDKTNNPLCIGGATVPGTTSLNPSIVIDKRDANSADIDGSIGNDTQTVAVGNSAVFKIRVTNNGTEDLKNLVLSDSMAPNCAGSVTLPSSYPGTWSNFATAGSGNHTDNILQVGEYFEYTCDKGNTTGNYTNSATVNAQGNTSNIGVTSTDTTPVLIPNVTNTTCANLSVSKSDNLVSYSCTGTGNINSYSIQVNGSQISTNSSGSITLGNGTHNFVCYINGSITSSSCQRSITISPNNTYPQIQVIKDDNDNRDDQQVVNMGGAAQFSVIVRNPGQEPLDNVVLNDPLTPECNRGTNDTINMIRSVGNGDTRLDPGESFTYVCTRSNVVQGTFPNYENRICVDGRGINSGTAVNSCDITRINFGAQGDTCQNLQLSNNGNQVTASCGPNGSYRLFILQGSRVVNTLQNPQGQFTFTLDDGNYKVACLRDGERNIQPNCQRNLTIAPEIVNNSCRMSSSVRFGGAPLHSELNCTSENYSACTIRINKDGAPWQTLYDCSTSMDFDQKGRYEATCILENDETCSTTIQVDVMTYIQTGPFLPIIIVIAMGTAGYLTYRRRKTV